MTMKTVRILLSRVSLVISLFVLMGPQVASALSAQQKQIVDSGARMVDAQQSSICSVNNAGVVGSKVYIVGDSLTVGMRDSGGLRTKLEGVDWTVTDIEATGGDTIAKALPKVEADSTLVNGSDTIVVALGTNKDSNFPDQLNSMITTLKRLSPSAKLYWMNAHTNAANYDDINTVISNSSGSLGYTVIDWKKEVTSNPGPYPFSGDGIHHTATGYGAKADYLVGQLGRAGTTQTGTLAGADNVEKAWRFLAGKGSGAGLGAEAVAGIIGNLQVEAPGVNPFAEEKPGQDAGGKGIAQWTATRRIDFEAKAANAGVITRKAAFDALPESEKAAMNDKALTFNLNYLWEEAIQRGDIDKLRDETVGSTTEQKIEQAVMSWERWFERAGVPALGRRYDEALAAYNKYSTTAPTTATDSGSSTCGGIGSTFEGGQKIAQIALAQVGIQEGDPECNKYFRGRGTCSSIQWCAAFVGWVYEEAGFKIGGGYRAKGVGKWFDDNKFFFKWTESYKPEVGDVFVKGRGGTGQGWEGIGHTGIVISLNGYTMVTVEGNSSNKVQKRTYEDYRKIPELIGFGRYIDKSSAVPVSGYNPADGAEGTYQSGDED